MESKANDVPDVKPKDEVAASPAVNNQKKLAGKSAWHDKQIVLKMREMKALLSSSADIGHQLNEPLRILVESEYQKCKNSTQTLPKHSLHSRIRAQKSLLNRMDAVLEKVYNDPARTKRTELHRQGKELLARDRHTVKNKFNAGVRQIPNATHSSHGNGTFTIGQNQGKTYDVPAYLKDEIVAKYQGYQGLRNLKPNEQVFDASNNIPSQHDYPECSHGTRFNLRDANRDVLVRNPPNGRLVTNTHASDTVSSMLDNGIRMPGTSITLHYTDDNDDNNGADKMCGTVHMRYNSTPSGRIVQRNMLKLGYNSLNDFETQPDGRLNTKQLAERKLERKLDALDKTQGSLGKDPAVYAKALKDTLVDCIPDLDWDKPANALNGKNALAVACLKGIPNSYLKQLGLEPVKIRSGSVEDAFDQIVDKTNTLVKDLED
ncbi:hypothetical protein JM93_01330 [Roseibium hamelinense]|uniref:Uncharacterized protein n=1 Tax=Roseibium hamelinense TaxID=150831 RepID=A0A562T9N9_9HYPH|nr:hypothetical protein [Roseibium hamelinense]MTI45286.1 hypothetical protein [Roseibium hamelinense]TWI90349.1 hypothetical protein JM93_01330 [Roseibium hamelinense]